MHWMSRIRRIESDNEFGYYPDENSYYARLRPRAMLLIGLMIFQSCSSFILAAFEQLLQKHPVVVFFMTMLVGAGGNAGNQAAVLVIRGVATGEITPSSHIAYLWSEAKMALGLSSLMVLVGLLRVIIFGYTTLDALAIGTSLFVIVISSVVIGASLPILIHRLGFDPAHAGATIQVSPHNQTYQRFVLGRMGTLHWPGS